MQSAFPNRSAAGHRLAQKLAWLKQAESRSRNEKIVIIAIPRGGVVIGDRIASELEAELDIVVSRKIGAPDNPEFAIGAVMPDGTYFLNQEHVRMLNIPLEYIQLKANTELKEIDRRLKCYRGSKEYSNKFEDKTVVLVDDGIATGSTILASAKWLKNKQNCKKLVIAAPVAPPDILDNIKQVADDVIVLDTPDPFIAIERFYEDFAQVTDEEVIGIMRKYGYSAP